ncbi:MAG: VWA domain-containing protein [Lysobacter sp.]
MIPAFDALHWLRPDWLWAFAALPLLAGWWWQRRRRASVWRDAVDPHLLAHLLDRRDKVRGRLALAIGVAGYAMAVLALAGPSWRQSEQPLWQGQAPLVIALDLSSASLAGDLPPTRLAQARSKLGTLLREREGGQVGLVAYAGAAFTVAPLTEDAANVGLFLEALHPSVMPVDGQRSDRAIAWSARLLEQAGFTRGRILLLTDHADAATRKAADDAWARGYSVSVIGLGTVAGAPYRGGDGTILNARLDTDSLRELAATGGGSYVALSRDDSDLTRLGVLDAVGEGVGAELADGRQDAGGQGMSWQDDGYWLLLPLMALALLAFRRGAPVMMLVFCLWLPGRSVHAAELWQRPDQRAHRTMEQAAQAYRQGDFAAAAKLYGELDSAEADYNRGNALARENNYAEAVKAYERALQRHPGMPDAVANKQAVEAAMKRQPPPGQAGQDNAKPDAAGQGADDQEKQSGQQDQESEASQGGSGPPKEESGQGKPDQSKARPEDRTSPHRSKDDARSPTPESPRPADIASQQAADQAQQERMQAALEKAEKDAGDGKHASQPIPESDEQRERRIANEAWLRRVPDDPGGLLREKFRIEYQRRLQQGDTEQ